MLRATPAIRVTLWTSLFAEAFKNRPVLRAPALNNSATKETSETGKHLQQAIERCLQKRYCPLCNTLTSKELDCWVPLHPELSACGLMSSAVNSTKLDFALQLTGSFSPCGLQSLAVTTPRSVELQPNRTRLAQPEQRSADSTGHNRGSSSSSLAHVRLSFASVVYWDVGDRGISPRR